MKHLKTVKASTRGSHPAPPPRARILLVDDDERNLLALSEVLKDIADIVTATSGREALRHLLKGDFAVILLDVYMPGMDGYEVAQLIRSRDQTSFIPIIFLSAVNKETEHLMRGYAMGAVDYVFKPVDPLMLKAKVSVFVELYSMRAQVEEKARTEQKLRDANYRAETERLKIARELDDTRRRQGALIASLPLALYVRTAGKVPGPRQFVGGDLERLTGYLPDAFTSDPDLWESHLHEDDRDSALDNRADGSGMRSSEFRWLHPDGNVRYFLDQAVELKRKDGSGEIAGTLLDVTDRKDLESQLVQSGKMEAVGQLTGGIAHDFNNLLAAVLGGLSLIERRSALDPKCQLILEQIRHAAEQGAELVRRMMAFSRKQELKPTSIEVASLCHSVGGLVEHALGGTIEIDWDCPKHVWNVFVDRGQLELAVLNLVLNARDAMPNGGRIGVSFDNHEVTAGDPGGLEPGRYVRLAVKDDGHGIPADIIARVTEPFFTTKETGKGTGLGLSMVFGFVRQSGGRLNIENHDHVGAVVELILPANGTAREAAPALAAAHPNGEKFAVRSVLLVDDDDMVRTIVEEQLCDMGLRVCALSGGAEALERLKATPDEFDMLLTDFAMPGMNGAETIDRAALIKPSLRFLLMTGFADAETLASLPADIEVIPKPIDYQRLALAFS